MDGDVTAEPSVRDFIERSRRAFGRIDILFNNAGIEGPVNQVTEYALSDFQRVLNVNVIGVFLCIKHVIPIMLEGGGGAIINMSSTAGLSGSRGVSAYNASKHAVIGHHPKCRRRMGGRRHSHQCARPRSDRLSNDELARGGAHAGKCG